MLVPMEATHVNFNDGNYEGAPRDGSAWMQGDCSVRVVRAFGFGSGRPVPAVERNVTTRREFKSKEKSEWAQWT